MRRLSLAIALLFLVEGIGLVAVSAQSSVTVLAVNALRLRSGPGTQYNVIATIPEGTTLPAFARTADSNWVKVDYKGQIGWVYTSQLRIQGNFDSLPVGDAANSPNPNAPGPTVPPTPTPPPDGGIESLTPYLSTDRVTYYHLVYWSDGLRITGYYAEPKGLDKHPAVILNRSGNRNVGALTGMELAPFAESGFVVVASQLRGGMGSEGNDQFGGADVHDVTNLIALLKGRPNVDANRIAMYGASRGGMMTYLALKAQSLKGARDIKVAATVGGLADLISWATEQPGVTSVYAELIGSTPRQSRTPFVARSATYWASLIRVPLLIQHGEADASVSVEQSRRLYSLLRARGAAVKLITYPGGDHSLSSQEAGLPEVLKWFQKYLAQGNEDFTWDTHRDAIYHAMFLLKNAR
jgi:fermentation-respiration switch protein FrsA (DUF1100 family)